MRIAGLLVSAIALAFVVSSNVPPLAVDCPASGMSVEACRDAVQATLRRGLPVPHPLILAARVEPGSDAETSTGHRATVTYDLLAWPMPAAVRLFYDVGGHWGGEIDRSSLELGVWWAAPIVVLLLVGGLLFTASVRARPGAATV